ncbi:hypothetical protein PLESTM_000080500 [Pleodorina starrii]|nr:hypothetical protein PLESTM_000080500 [Pleodorina starrii]
MEDGDEQINRGKIEGSVGTASGRVSFEDSEASDARKASKGVPLVGVADGGDIASPSLAGDRSNVNVATSAGVGGAIDDVESLRNAAGEASVPDRGADLDAAAGEASSELPVGTGGGDSSRGGSLSSVAAAGLGASGYADGEGAEGAAAAAAEGAAQLDDARPDAESPQSQQLPATTVTEEVPDGAQLMGEPSASAESEAPAIAPAEASGVYNGADGGTEGSAGGGAEGSADNGAADGIDSRADRRDGDAAGGGYGAADGGSLPGPDDAAPLGEELGSAADDVPGSVDGPEARNGVSAGAEAEAEVVAVDALSAGGNSAEQPDAAGGEAADGDAPRAAASLDDAARLDGGASAAAASSSGGSSGSGGGDGVTGDMRPSASSLGPSDGRTSARRSGEGAGTDGGGGGAAADAAAEAPAAAVRPPSAGSDAAELPSARGGRRSSYVSPQYDTFERSASTLSSGSRRAGGAVSVVPSTVLISAVESAAQSAAPSAAPSMSPLAGASVAGASERPPTGVSSSTSRPGSAARRGSAAGSPVVSRPGSAKPRQSSETTAALPNGSGGGAPPEAAAASSSPSSSLRPSGTASTGAASTVRQGSVAYAWRASSAGGDSAAAAAATAAAAVAAARPGSAEDAAATPRASGLSRNASLSSETSNVARRISGSAVVQQGDDGGGLAAAMVSAAATPPLLPPVASQPDASSSSVYGSTTDRTNVLLYSSAGELRRPASQGAVVSGPPNPLPPLPPSASSGLLLAVERSKPRSVVSAPAGDIRSVSGGAAGSASGGAGGAAAPGTIPAVRPHPPMHLFQTHVQPKGPLDECTTQAASQHVRTVWSTSNICGIRSLPNALSPDFRDRLYEELVQAAHRDRTFTAPSHKAQLSYGLEGGPLGMPLSVGQKQVARINPLAGMFTQYEYLPSEYDRVKLTGKFDRLKHKLAQTSPNEFVVRAPPAALHGAPAFSEFTYATDPTDAYTACLHADADLGRSKVVAGPFYPSGRVHQSKVLKGRVDECMMRLCKQLSDDWPNSFMQVFEDRNGSVVACFHKASAVSEGDLSSYMNTFAKRDHVVATYQLTKDATRWGLVDEASGAAFYVLWPPWVRHRYLGPHTAPPASETPSGRPGTRGSNSSDDEEDGDAGAGEDAGAGQGQGQGQGTDGGDGVQVGGGGVPMGYPNPPLDVFATFGAQRRTGVY